MKYLPDSYLDSSVIIMTRIGAGDLRISCSTPSKGKRFFSSPQHPDWFAETQPAARLMGTDSTFTEVKGLRYEAPHSFPSSVKAENKCSLPQL